MDSREKAGRHWGPKSNVQVQHRLASASYLQGRDDIAILVLNSLSRISEH